MRSFLIIAGFFFLGCQSSEKGNKLPATRPVDLTLSYYNDGGMIDFRENMFISKDSCIYEINDEGKKQKITFNLNETDLDELYSVLKKNRFDEIEFITEKEVYDRGGLSIRISWGHNAKQLEVSNAGRSFIKKNWLNEWRVACDYLTLIIHKKTIDHH